jgi:mono/diheme cytochrome c family protein
MLLSLLLALMQSPQPPPDRSGAEIFTTVCAMCHIEDTPGLKAPSVNALRRLTVEQIKDALFLGPMDAVGAGLTDREIDNVAAFLAAPAPKPQVGPSRP